MSRSVVIVESPTKVRSVKKYLGKDFDVKSSMGHVRDLPPKELGVDVDKSFRPQYTILSGKEKVVRELKAAAKAADTVYLATDPDREGEAIAWHVAQVMGLSNEKARRVTFHEITQSAVRQAVENPQQIDMNKVDAQQARRVLDRLVGYQVSPLLWKTVRRGLSAGRVQSVALRLVCEREEAIEVFVPEEYWSIGVALANGDISFDADLWQIDGKKAMLGSEEEAKAVAEEIGRTEFGIESIVKKRQKRRPVAPFITSTLQQEASRKLSSTPRNTMRIAQQLYEGTEVNGEITGLITYMRTDSTRVADEAKAAVREKIVEQYGPKYCPKRPNSYKRGSAAQDAHEAIRPTSMELAPDAIKDSLSADQFKLYQIIWNRFVASQMTPQELDITTVMVQGGRIGLRTSATVVAFDGFTRVYLEGRDEEGEEQEHTIPPALLEAWDRGESDPAAGPRLQGYAAQKVSPEQHFTKPPARFSEAMLIRELESSAIGRPSTYAQIVSTIIDRNYVVMKESRLHPNDLGRVVNRILVEQFPKLFNVAFTAEMEGELDRIEQNGDRWQAVLKDFYGDFESALASAMERRQELKESTQEKTDEVCEKCGRPMITRFGPRGKFLSCSGFPECKNAKPLPTDGATESIPVPDVKCPVCTGPMVMRDGRYGEFLACENYPDCKGTLPIPTGVGCPRPDCEGSLVIKTSRRGKRFYGCDKYPDCEVVYWDRPVALSEPDPESGLNFQLEKVKRDGSTAMISAIYPPKTTKRRDDDKTAAKKKAPAKKKAAAKKTTRKRAPRKAADEESSE